MEHDTRHWKMVLVMKENSAITDFLNGGVMASLKVF